MDSAFRNLARIGRYRRFRQKIAPADVIERFAIQLFYRAHDRSRYPDLNNSKKNPQIVKLRRKYDNLIRSGF